MLSNILLHGIVKYKATINAIELLQVVHQCYIHYNHVQNTWQSNVGLRIETNIMALQQFLVRMAHNTLTLPNPVDDV